MSLDNLQVKNGQTALDPLPTASGFPGGVAFGREAGHVEGAAALTGGALYTTPTPRTGTPPAIGNGGTVTHNGCGVAIVTPAAAVTGVIVQAGNVHGQHLKIINTAAAVNTVTMAVVGTSNVANGVSCIITGLNCVDLVWNGLDSRWYQTRAA